ncbi:MAG TPA: DUF3386 domain-containing protein [Chroococcidiopsis sp.]
MTEPLDARSLFRSAYENRYTWDKNFPGYTASVTLQQGTEVHQARIQVKHDLSAEVLDVDDAQVKQSILGQVREIAIHRIRRTFEETHGKNTFTFGETDESGAVEILMGGKAEGDRYKLRNNEVVMVHRHIHNIVVTIHTHSSHQTGEGYLSHCYDSVYRDPETGEIKGESEFEDEYDKVGDYFILTRRVIRSVEDGQPMTTEFKFTNVALLQPVAV